MRDISIITILLLTVQFSTAQNSFQGSASEPGVHEYVHVQVEPVPLNIAEIQNQIPYPAKAIKAGIGGKMFFRILIDEKGEYQKHKITRAIDPSLMAAAEPYMSNLKFTPAIKDNQPVKYWVNVPIIFNPNKEAQGKLRKTLFHQTLMHKIVASNHRSEKYLQAGLDAINQGEYMQAVNAVSRSINLNPRRKNKHSNSEKNLCYAHYLRGKVQARLGKWESARLDFTQAIGFFQTMGQPDQELSILGADLYLERSFIALIQGDAVRAINDISWVEKNFRDQTYLVDNYFEAYPLSDREILLGRKTLDQLRNVFPLNTNLQTMQLHLNLALREKPASDYPVEKDEIEGYLLADLLETRPAVNFIQNKDYEKAFAALENAFEANPENGNIYLVKAFVMYKIGAAEEACRELSLARHYGVSKINTEVAPMLEKEVCHQINTRELDPLLSMD